MTESSQDSLQRPLDWRTWFLWVAVCAVEPVLYVIALTAFNKPVLHTDPNATLISRALIVLILVTLPMPLVLQWCVLRRVAPNLRLWTWFVGMLFVAGIYFGLQIGARELFQISHHFRIALIPMRANDGMLTFSELLNLPWGRLLFQTSMITAVMMLILVRILGKNSGRPWYLFLIAVSVGACIANMIEQFYSINFIRIDSYSLNGQSWFRRINELSFRGGIGAVFGASSGTVLAVLFQYDDSIRKRCAGVRASPKPVVMLALTIAIAILAPVFVYLIGDQGIHAGIPAVRKVFSAAPSQDRSEGEHILSYAHNAVFTAPKYPVVRFAPDSKSFIALNADRILQRIDVASGASLGEIGEQLRPFEGYDLDWSMGGRFFALRTDGEEVKIPKTWYTGLRNRIRLYALPEYKVLGEFEYRDEECLYSHDTSVIFDPDGKSLWVRCAQFYTQPKPESVLAIRLDVPSMKIIDIRRYDANASNDSVEDLARIGDSIVYWQQASERAAPLYFRNLTYNQDIVVLSNLTQANLAGNLTFQSGSVRIEKGRIALFFCGKPTDVSDPAPRVEKDPPVIHSFCRTLIFDMHSGALIEKIDDPNRKSNKMEILDEQHKLRVQAVWQENDKSGEISVWDVATGRKRQRIVTMAQRPLRFSPDGRWLVMYALDANTLRIYRIMP